MSEVIIRLADISDSEGIAKVHTDSWITSYKDIVHQERLDYMDTQEYRSQRLEKWKKTFQDKTSGYIFVATINGEIVGFTGGGVSREVDIPGESELYAIYLLEDYKKQGIGRKLFSTVKNALFQDGYSSFALWTLKDSTESNAFYKKMGGEIFGTKEYEISGKPYTLNGYSFDTK